MRERCQTKCEGLQKLKALSERSARCNRAKCDVVVSGNRGHHRGHHRCHLLPIMCTQIIELSATKLYIFSFLVALFALSSCTLHTHIHIHLQP